AARRVIVVLHEALGSSSSADELDAPVELREVSGALERLRLLAAACPIELDLATGLEEIGEAQPDCVFNLVDALGGHGEVIGVVPRMVGSAGISFTGCSADAFTLTSQKIAAKRLMEADGIATREWLEDGGRRGDDTGRW